MRAVAGVAAALVVVGSAGAHELDTPRSYELFFGRVVVHAPARAAHADLFADGRLVASQGVERSRLVFRLRVAPGRYDVRVRFRAAGGGSAGRAVSRSVWLLPRSAQRGRRERGTRDRRLARRLARLGRAYPGWAALWTHDLSTGRTAGWNADAPFPAASTVKLGVLLAALHRFGPRPERSVAWGDIRDLATWSSNLASNRLLLRLGGSESRGAYIVQQALWRAGARASTFTGFYRLGTARRARLAGDVQRPLPFLAYRRTTAHDLGRLLVELHLAALGNGLSLRRTGLTRHEARVALGLLLSSDPRGANLGLFRPSLGRRVPAAQKQGWTTSIRHTAAIVYAPRGPRILVLLTYRPGIRSGPSSALGAEFVHAAGLSAVRGG